MSTSLQDSLFSRQPELHWLLDNKNNLIEPLLHQWGQQIMHKYREYQHFANVKDVFLWSIEKNASAPALQSTFDWLHKMLVTSYGQPKDADNFLHKLKEHHPALLQTLMENVQWRLSVWDTSFAFKYAPDPTKLWENRTDWHTLYKGTNPLAWSKKANVHANASIWAYPNKKGMKALHDIMGPKAFLLWQYGAYLTILTQNTYYPNGTPSGRKYGFAAALMLLEPAIELELAPNAETLAQHTVQRYKGRDLVEDMLTGLNYCAEKYESKGFSQGVDYCSKMFSSIVPYAIKEGLTSELNAQRMDQRITQAVHTGRMEQGCAQTWFEARIQHARDKIIDFKGLSPLWPETLRKYLIALETKMQQHSDDVSTALAMFERWSYEPTATKAFLESLTLAQWEQIQVTLDNNANTSAVVALLQTPHPWIEAYKSSPRARIAVVAASMVFMNEPQYPLNPKYRGVIALFSTDNSTPMGQLSLPQPLAYFAKCFPQYRDTWQKLGIEMASYNPMGAPKARVLNSDYEHHVPAKKVVNALASLLLGKPVDAEALLQVRESLDSNMEYETLVQSQFNTEEVFELPATFDESMFACGPAGM